MSIAWRRFRWPLIILLCLFLINLIPPVKGVTLRVFAPLFSVTRAIGDTMRNSTAMLFQIPNLAKENGQLQSQINELKSALVTNQEIKHENDLLRKELSLALNTNKNLLAAQVISRSSSVTQQTFIINKGQKDGFAKGMPVIAQGFLIGRVEEAFDTTSRVLLITSSESLLPIVLQNSRAVGLLRGGVEGLVAGDIPGDVVVATGESIVTGNVGNVVASGIPVGSVAVVTSTRSDVFQSVRINSPVDLSRLEVVFGLKP